jgi:mannan endo-1,4-beta-mannosidase
MSPMACENDKIYRYHCLRISGRTSHHEFQEEHAAYETLRRTAENRMNRALLFLLCLVTLVFSSCSFLSLFQERDDFIRVRGTQFIHNNKPYYFAGTNLWYGYYLGAPGTAGNRPRLLRELDSLKANGIVNVRVLAASEESYIRGSVKPVIQPRPGDFDESLLQGLDFFLAEMAKRRMHCVLFLNNYWEWSGGMAIYNVWSGKEALDPYDTTKGWNAFMDFNGSFYSNQPANKLFCDYVRKIVTRTNTVNGRVYSEDPTIMAWQLANEPRPGTVSPRGVANLPSFNRWIDETALFIHSLDTNHLVSTGSEGTVGSLLSAENFLQSHSTPHIGYLTMHLWPRNWGWFDPQRAVETMPETQEKATEYITNHLALARKLNKPIVLEEFGIDRDSSEIRPGTPTTVRDGYYEMIVRMVYDSARAGAPIAGYNFWAWGGEASARHADGVWRKGDPFVGDPPQEPQGRNSIFLSDTSTLQIIRNNAMKFMRLGNADPLVTARRP